MKSFSIKQLVDVLINLKLTDEKIIIEERNEDEIHYVRGKDINDNIINVRITPDKSRGSNYAFDTTPSKYISGLITENGICLASENDIRDKNAK